MPEDQQNARKRLRNFQKFVTQAMREDPIQASDKKKEAVGYASSYLDKLAGLNTTAIESGDVTLNNYQWPTQALSSALKEQNLFGLDGTNDPQIFNEDA